MARVLSGALRRQFLLQESGEAIIAFLTISHSSLADPIRVAGDGADYLFQGETWTGFPFGFSLLTDEDGSPRCQIDVQNVDRRIGDALKALSSPARVRLDLVAASEFDQTATPRVALGTPPIEYTARHLFLVNVSVTAATVTGDVVSWDYFQTTWPARLATQDRYPGLFR